MKKKGPETTDKKVISFIAFSKKDRRTLLFIVVLYVIKKDVLFDYRKVVRKKAKAWS